MEEVIRKALTSHGEILVDAYKIQIRVNDISTLDGHEWLNDEIINFYLQMIVVRSVKFGYRTVHAFTTFFYERLKNFGPSSMQRWTKKVDLFRYSLVLVPVHWGTHWCLAAIDMDSKSIVYYDSAGGDDKVRNNNNNNNNKLFF